MNINKTFDEDLLDTYNCILSGVFNLSTLSIKFGDYYLFSLL